MSEKRSMDEIQKEYGQVCAMIGEKNFKIEVLKAELQQGYAKAFELGKEYANAQIAAAPQPIPSISEVVASSDAPATQEVTNESISVISNTDSAAT